MRALVLAAIAVSVLLASVDLAHGSFPGRNGLIAVGGEGYFLRCGDAHVVRPDGGGLRPLRPRQCHVDGGFRLGPDWSADGRRLAYITRWGERAGVMAFGGGRLREFRPPPVLGDNGFREFDTGSKPSFSPDGRRVLLTRNTLQIYVASMNGAPLRTLRRGRRPRWSPDGRRVALISRGRAALMDARTGRMVRRYPMRVDTVDWSPDGRRLLGVRRSRLLVLERYGKHGVRRVRLPRRFRSRWSIEDAVFSPDGLQIAFTAYRVVGSDCGPVDPECIPYFADALFVVPGIGGSPRKLVDGDRDDYGDWPNSVSWQPIVE